MLDGDTYNNFHQNHQLEFYVCVIYATFGFFSQNLLKKHTFFHLFPSLLCNSYDILSNSSQTCELISFDSQKHNKSRYSNKQTFNPRNIQLLNCLQSMKQLLDLSMFWNRNIETTANYICRDICTWLITTITKPKRVNDIPKPQDNLFEFSFS